MSKNGVDFLLSGLDGRLGKGNFQMVISSHVIVVKLHQSLDGFLHRRHLDQGHLTVPEEAAQTNRSISWGVTGKDSQYVISLQGRDYSWKVS